MKWVDTMMVSESGVPMQLWTKRFRAGDKDYTLSVVSRYDKPDTVAVSSSLVSFRLPNERVVLHDETENVSKRAMHSYVRYLKAILERKASK